jgi:hypothetical protein
VYAHTGATFRDLVKRVDEVMPFTDRGAASRVDVVGTDYWPLPYYLRRYPNVGYPADVSQVGDVPLIISPAEMEEELAKRLKGDYVAEFHQLRPHVLLILRVERSVWERFLASRAVVRK